MIISWPSLQPRKYSSLRSYIRQSLQNSFIVFVRPALGLDPITYGASFPMQTGDSENRSAYPIAITPRSNLMVPRSARQCTPDRHIHHMNMNTGSPPKFIHHPQYPIRLIPPTKASPRTIFTILSSSTSSNTLELRTSHIFVAVLPMWPFVFCANDRRRVAMSVGATECSWRNSMLSRSSFSAL